MPQKPSLEPDDGPVGRRRPLWIALAGFLLMVLISRLMTACGPPETALPYSAVEQMIRDGQVASADLQEHAIIVATAGADPQGAEVYRAITPSQGDPDLLPLLEANNIEIRAEEPAGVSILPMVLPWIVILGVYMWLQRRMMGDVAGGPAGRAAWSAGCWADASSSPRCRAKS